MEWVFLIFAGLLEIVGVIAFNYCNGFTSLKWSIWWVLAMGASFYALSISLVAIPMGTAYAIWTGIGSAGSVMVGMFLLGESRDIKKIIFVSCIIASIIGLKISANY